MDDFIAWFIGGVAEDRAVQRARGRLRTFLLWVQVLGTIVGGCLLLLVFVLLIRDTLR